MQVDHFNPRLGEGRRHRYSNLHLATPHCNNRKRDYWPTAAMIKAGIYLIDPCKERDYGAHLFEDPETHHLIGTTPAGRYQIEIMDLNHETFVEERRVRALMRRYYKTLPVKIDTVSARGLLGLIAAFKTLLDELIPDIPPPPGR